MKKVFSLEGKSQKINAFIGETVSKIREVGIYILLVKGLHCVFHAFNGRKLVILDFFLDEGNYEKAKAFYLLSLHQ